MHTCPGVSFRHQTDINANLAKQDKELGKPHKFIANIFSPKGSGENEFDFIQSCLIFLNHLTVQDQIL